MFLKDHNRLEETDYICPECKGEGRIKRIGDSPFGAKGDIICNRCQGKGKLDWIQNITGIKIKRGSWFGGN